MAVTCRSKAATPVPLRARRANELRGGINTGTAGAGGGTGTAGAGGSIGDTGCPPPFPGSCNIGDGRSNPGQTCPYWECSVTSTTLLSCCSRDGGPLGYYPNSCMPSDFRRRCLHWIHGRVGSVTVVAIRVAGREAPTWLTTGASRRQSWIAPRGLGHCYGQRRRSFGVSDPCVITFWQRWPLPC